MTTQETAKMTKTPYFIEYISYKGGTDFYFQLVRTSDLAILYSNKSYHEVIVECWRRDINKSEVTTW